ncbi:MAG: energy-coupling factor transporter transmembrane component T family protein [Candidatus Loosdrechtia sp.]|uniref:energy-coupling factor transporter transmembrane component T family protein n=1 Tax=Candidatus Loosdrechtia sp. TaxID=3101272 RepID=UPI003A6B43BF|nr:MAG: energy-coupling factor transporter transmembrane component T [Candidatus Jettenia sp. AMX2]
MDFTSGIIENLDPRTKMLSFFSILFCLVLTPIPRLKDFGLYFLLIVLIVSLSKVTSHQIFRKVFVFFPFVFFIATVFLFLKEGDISWSVKIGYWKLSVTYEGVWMFLNIIIKSGLSILLLGIASLTTAFSDFLKGLEMLRVPRVIVMSMLFLYRSGMILFNDAKRLMQGGPLRCFDSGYKAPFQIIGYMIVALFIKICERTERMSSVAAVQGGCNREIVSTQRFRLSYVDVLFILGIIVLLLLIVSGVIHKIGYLKKEGTHLWMAL